MRQHCVAMALGLLTTAFAGCIGGDEDPGGGDDPATRTGEATGAAADPLVPGAAAGNATLPHTFRLTACSTQLGLFPFPIEFVGGLPDGFSPAPFDEAGLLAQLFVAGIACGDATIDGASLGPATTLMGGFLVVPPAEYEGTGVDVYGIPLGSFNDQQNVTAAFDAWGLAGPETAEVQSGVTEAAVARTGFARASGSFAITLGTIIAGLPAGGETSGIRLFAVEDGLVTGAVDARWTGGSVLEGGEATLAFEGVPVPPIPPPIMPGVAIHWWGDDYGFNMTYSALAAPGA